MTFSNKRSGKHGILEDDFMKPSNFELKLTIWTRFAKFSVLHFIRKNERISIWVESRVKLQYSFILLICFIIF